MRSGFSSRCAGRGKKIFSPSPLSRSYVLRESERVGQEKKCGRCYLASRLSPGLLVGYLFGKQAPEESVRGVFDIRKQPLLADK